MRTTVNLDADVQASVQQLQREGLGVSEAVNTLARRGIQPKRADFVFTPIVYDIGVTLDVSNIGQTLELLDDLDATDSFSTQSAVVSG